MIRDILQTQLRNGRFFKDYYRCIPHARWNYNTELRLKKGRLNGIRIRHPASVKPAQILWVLHSGAGQNNFGGV